MTAFNVALIGPGRIAQRSHFPALAAVPGLRLWSVLSRDASRAADFAARFHAAAPSPAHTDLDTLLSDPQLHAVIIASPDGLHAEQAVRAARAGKHVFCEKPLSTSLEGARAMIDACAKADVRLAVAYHLRHHAGHRALVERVRAGALGELRHMRAQWTSVAPDASNWRASREVGRWWSLAGVGTHCLDLIRWVMVPACGEVVEVSSVISRAVWKGPHDETAVVAMRFESGATAELVSSMVFASPHRLELYGSKSFAIGEGTFGHEGKGSLWVENQPVPFIPVDPFVGELADFAAAIRDHREPEVSGLEGLRNVELLLQAAPEVT